MGRPARSTFETFDPNDPSAGHTLDAWATYIPTRRGSAFKIHDGRGPALNACFGGRFILYKWWGAAHRWVEVERFDPAQATACSRCARPVATRYPERFWVGKPELRYVSLCGTCKDSLHGIKRAPIDDRSI